MKMENFLCNRQFRRNVLIVDRTGCGKTYFIQKLPVNSFFGDSVKEEKVSYILLDKTQEAEIQFWWSCDTEFHYPKDKDILKIL